MAETPRQADAREANEEMKTARDAAKEARRLFKRMGDNDAARKADKISTDAGEVVKEVKRKLGGDKRNQ